MSVKRYIEDMFGPELDDIIVRLGIKADAPLYSLTKAYFFEDQLLSEDR